MCLTGTGCKHRGWTGALSRPTGSHGQGTSGLTAWGAFDSIRTRANQGSVQPLGSGLALLRRPALVPHGKRLFAVLERRPMPSIHPHAA